MTVDVDAVNERLNGLVNLLHVVGIDGVDPDALLAEQKKLGGGAKKSGSQNTKSTAASSTGDAQILEIIKKLQQAQADSPEILAALKSPELRALASLAATKKQTKPEAKKAAPSLDDVMDDDDNYPKIGPGYSDDISVVSDLTTPTVMTRQQIAEEELYKDINGGPGALPPMHIGVGAGQPSRPAGHGVMGTAVSGGGKTRNLVSQVRPGATRRAIAKTGGAAAQRRLNYQQAMAKLQSNEYGAPTAAAAPTKKEKSYMENFSPKKNPNSFFSNSAAANTKDPSEFPSIAEQKKGRSTRNKAAVSAKRTKKTALAAQEEADVEFDDDPQARVAHRESGSIASGGGGNTKRRTKERSPASKDIDWAAGGNTSGWPAFGDVTGSSKDVFVDNDGFFSSDPFAPNPKGTPSSSSRKSSKKTRDDGQGVKVRKPKKENQWSSETSKVKKERSGKKKSRRASLSM